MTGLVLALLGLVLLLPGSSRVRLRSGLLNLARFTPDWRRRRESPGALIDVIGGFRDELRSGGGLRDAFERAGQGCAQPAIRTAVSTCRLGGDVPAALRATAQGQPVLLSLAALWQVCEGSGAALAGALDRLLEVAEQSERIRREVAAQLAGPRATVRVLAMLPLVGLGMGLLMGADPLGFLVGTPWGWVCLALAAALEAVGVVWMRRLVAGIESQL